jgi:hypothetical protein
MHFANTRALMDRIRTIAKDDPRHDCGREPNAMLSLELCLAIGGGRAQISADHSDWSSRAGCSLERSMGGGEVGILAHGKKYATRSIIKKGEYHREITRSGPEG